MDYNSVNSICWCFAHSYVSGLWYISVPLSVLSFFAGTHLTLLVHVRAYARYRSNFTMTNTFDIAQCLAFFLTSKSRHK